LDKEKKATKATKQRKSCYARIEKNERLPEQVQPQQTKQITETAAARAAFFGLSCIT
jgi:hypothetical protein